MQYCFYSGCTAAIHLRMILMLWLFMNMGILENLITFSYFCLVCKAKSVMMNAAVRMSVPIVSAQTVKQVHSEAVLHTMTPFLWMAVQLLLWFLYGVNNMERLYILFVHRLYPNPWRQQLRWWPPVRPPSVSSCQPHICHRSSPTSPTCRRALCSPPPTALGTWATLCCRPHTLRRSVCHSWSRTDEFGCLY